jgi:hypothetical protein
MLRHTRRRHIGLAAFALAGVVAVTTAAAATGPTVVLGVAGVHPKKRQLCRGESHATLRPASQVKRNVAVTLTGTVKPAPARTPWHATLVVKRCVLGDYKQVWKGRAPGGRAGAFRVRYTPRLPGLYVARAKYGRNPSTDSDKLYFSAS